MQEELAAHALDASRAVEDLDPQLLQQLQPDKLDSWLALRGQLGCGLLAHALAKRHLVDYGVDRWVCMAGLGTHGSSCCLPYIMGGCTHCYVQLPRVALPYSRVCCGPDVASTGGFTSRCTGEV